jgi:hypothetical protein
MTRLELLNLANKGYPDGFLAEYYDEQTGKPKDRTIDGLGDTLAEFIVIELSETFDKDACDTDQINAALSAIDSAIRELDSVQNALLGK